MITNTTAFICGGCARRVVFEIKNATALPDLDTVLRGIGWHRYLQGACLCGECVMNEETIESVARMHLRAMEDNAATVTVSLDFEGVEQARPKAAEETNEPTSRSYRRSRLQASPVTDEMLQESLERHEGNVRLACADTGLSSPAVYSRIKLGRVKQYGRHPITA